MTLIIPGVEIRVIKELVPRQLGATGILGIVGHTEIDRSREALRPVSTLQEFRELFGAGSVVSMPEVAQAFANGVREVVCANVPATRGSKAGRTVSVRLADSSPGTMRVTARTSGRFGNRIATRFVRKGDGSTQLVDVEISMQDRSGALQTVETHRNLATDASAADFFVTALNQRSAYIRIEAPNEAHLTPANNNPEATPDLLVEDGDEALPGDYLHALERLESAPQIDLIACSCNYAGSEAKRDTTTVYAGIVSHCERMSAIARNRIGFGQIIDHGVARPNLVAASEMAAILTSDRFALVAPHGFLGAVVGRVAGLAYYQSPTFKTLGGVAELSFDFTDSDLRTLLQAGVLPVDKVPRKGIAVVKGIFADTSQISVQRIADRSVRHVQNIAQDFIGLLNTQAQRLALKQLITGALTRMSNEGALVPSTDGTSPPFVVDVASSGDDFAQGIVRVHCAVRPVRAIDYIYATILVQAT